MGMEIICKMIGHDWSIIDAPKTGPLFRTCRRCGKYEDAIPGRLYRDFHFTKIQPNSITYKVLKQWTRIDIV
mgnify:CR=1 FL=1